MANNVPLSALNIAAEISAGRLSPEDVFKHSASVVDARENELQVFSHSAGPLVAGDGPLAGIAIGVKDVFDTRDMPTTYGSPIYENHKPVADAALVNMLKSAGASIAGKTVTTEFAWFSPGATRNPHNLDHTPGGSSSGSAAGVAAGYFPAAIGTQTGGSIVRPAAFCGVSGYKPSFRLFPTVGLKHFSWSLDTIGFFAASAADAGFVAAACSGRDLMVDQQDKTAPRIGIYRSTIDELIDDEMAAALEQIISSASAAGATITETNGLDTVEKGREAHAPIQDFEARLALADELTHAPNGLSDALHKHLVEAAAITPEQYDNARRTANHARKACHDLFASCDVLVMPSAPGAAPRGLASTGDSSFCRLWTLMGLPCVNVTGLTNAQGLPLGVQVVGRFGSDSACLQAAHWLETTIRSKA